jgi:uncharacterized protein GlcG (DUF336 family)
LVFVDGSNEYIFDHEVQQWTSFHERKRNAQENTMLTITRLSIDDAYVLIAGARVKAQEIGVPMCIAITDESGNLIAFERMDGGKMTSITLAIDKSFTAVGIQKGTHALGDANQPGKPAHGISSTLQGRMVTVGGGLPVFAGNAVVGGIGVSSGSPAQDFAVAEAGVLAFSEAQK